MIESDKSDKNPDAALVVEFYSKPVKNEYASEEQSRPIFTDVDYIKIMNPGDQLSEIHQAVREDHKRRFPLHWAHYQNVHGKDQKEIGTPLTQWPLLSPAMCEELRALKFRTVESIAHASDAQIQNIGMAGGMGAHALRERAQRYLRAALGDSENNKQAEELAALKKQHEESQEKMRQMQEQMADLLAAKTDSPAKKKSGPKPKVKAEVTEPAANA